MKKRVIWILTISVIFCGWLAMTCTSHAAGGKWEQLADMPTPRAAFAADVVDGVIYVIGGGRLWAQAHLGPIEAYDTLTNTWAKKAAMPTPRVWPSISVVDGILYVIGGRRNDGVSGAVEAYNPVTDTWVKKSPMPTPRFVLSTTVIDGKIYAIGGIPDWAPGLSTVEVYDPKTDTWTKKADMPTPRLALTTGAIAGKIVAIGGMDRGGPGDWFAVSAVEVYEPQTDTWTKKAEMPTPRGRLSPSGCVVGEQIYVIGGTRDRDRAGTSTVQAYTPKTDTWANKADMPTPRAYPATAVVNGKIYVMGGFPVYDLVAPAVATVEVYTPDGLPFAVSPQDKLPLLWGTLKSGQPFTGQR